MCVERIGRLGRAAVASHHGPEQTFLCLYPSAEDLVEDISYSPASPADFSNVRALLNRCDLPTEDLEPAHLETFVLCRSGEQLAGTIGLQPFGNFGLLRSLAVEQEFRRQGLAHNLWERARHEAIRRGIKVLYLLTTTAEGLFARWGFRSVPRDHVPEVVWKTTEFSSLCPSTAIVMSIDL